MKKHDKPELLAPGGSLEKCRIAYLYGADAVYAGGKAFNLRNQAQNLDTEELAEAAFLARSIGKRFYVTVNAYARESDFKTLPAYLEYLQDIRVDGIIVSDPGVLLLARRHAPQLPLHLSTQANTCNSSAIAFWESSGVRRINVARELTFDELAAIRTRAQVELEVFVHGAMCISYSGRCLMSAFLNGRSANRGHCTQPCRWTYHLVEEKRPGEYFPIFEDKRGTAILNSKDLCLIEHLHKLTGIGIDAFKIEGRMKSALYLAAVVRAYRQTIDRIWANPENYTPDPAWIEDLKKVSHRPYTGGFLFEDLAAFRAGVDSSGKYLQTHTLAGIVRPDPVAATQGNTAENINQPYRVYLQCRTRLESGMELEFLHPDGKTSPHTLDAFQDLSGNELTVAHPNTWIRFETTFQAFPGQVVRTKPK